MAKTALTELAHVIRSKNAGPTLLTLDLFFSDHEGYLQAQRSPQLSLAAVAALYDSEPDQISRYELPEINALKFTLPRALCAGSLGDGDVYGAQQHGPLLGIRL